MENILIALIGAVFGGGFISLLTIKPAKRKAAAEAENAELTNITAVIKIWKETAEKLSADLESQRQRTGELTRQIEILNKEVTRLTCINNKIMNLLNVITPDNLEITVGKIKEVIEKK